MGHQHLRPGTVVRSDGLACFRGVKPAGCEHELIQTIMACKTGLDVYVEKPLALTVAEGRKMLDTARHYRTVVQTGSQQRSGPHYAEAIKLVQEGAIGAVHHVEAGFERNSLLVGEIQLVQNHLEISTTRCGSDRLHGMNTTRCVALSFPLVLGSVRWSNDQLGSSQH